MAFRRSIDSQAGDFGRRRFLRRFLSGAALGSAGVLTQTPRLLAAEFWNAKDPSAWTEEEIVLLTSKSPWARAAVPGIKHADDPTDPSGEGTAAGGGGGRATFRRATINVIVRWESAQPILDALRAPLSADFAGHYVISVTNLPLPPRRPGRGEDGAPDEALERMQAGAALQVRDKGTAEAGIVRRTRIGSILFGFSKDLLRLSPSDREIFFLLDTDTLTLKTRFDGKEMMYHGKMAV